MTDAQQISETIPLEGANDRRFWRRWRITIGRAAFGIGCLALWQWSADAIGHIWIASPAQIIMRIGELIRSGELLRHTTITLEEAFFGYILGAVTAIILPFLLRLSPRLMRALDPYMGTAMALPKLALAPLIILWFGIGILSKVLFVASLVFFLVFFNVLAGVLSTERGLVAMARVVGAREWLIAREVVWNTTVPYLFTALKVSLPRGISGAVVAEFLAADGGLGYYIETSRDQADVVGIFTGIVIVTIIVLLVNAVVQRVQLRALSWRPVDREMVL